MQFQHTTFWLLQETFAQIGPEDSLFTFNTKETNRNGEKLADYAEEFQLLVTNTKFMKPTNKLWTFQLPSGKRTQIDYVLVRKKKEKQHHSCELSSLLVLLKCWVRPSSCIMYYTPKPATVQEAYTESNEGNRLEIRECHSRSFICIHLGSPKPLRRTR